MAELRPISSDPVAAAALARRAILSRNDPEAEAAPFLSMVERDVANGSAAGVLRVDGTSVVGIALWEPPTALGVVVQVLYLVDGAQSTDAYRTFLSEIQAPAGPIALAPGHLAGLTDAQEEEVMGGMAFARFSRSEMRFPPEAATPESVIDSSARLRGATVDDLTSLARLHELAYASHFDRYLFLADLDPTRDAEITMKDLLGGRYGEFLPWASAVIDGEQQLAAACLVVRASYGPLIADVMVDPRVQGRGLGQAVLVESVRALRTRGESVIVLNVTEGNARANRLYERLGFVRSLGPSHGWYSTRRIPVSPDSA